MNNTSKPYHNHKLTTMLVLLSHMVGWICFATVLIPNNIKYLWLKCLYYLSKHMIKKYAFNKESRSKNFLKNLWPFFVDRLQLFLGFVTTRPVLNLQIKVNLILTEISTYDQR